MNWSDFEVFYELIDRYMLPTGEGETIASQTVTAVNKLVYRWFHGGDVYDNTHYMGGWWNDLSSYANWLYSHHGDTSDTATILDRIADCESEGEYTLILYDLCKELLTDEKLKKWSALPKDGTIYECEGRFEFR